MTTATKCRPIIFTGEMVKAILDGRKTQTRRVVKPQHIPADGRRTLRWENQTAEELMHSARCPYGVPGDALWVREAFCPCPCSEQCTEHIAYRADDLLPPRDRWRPSIHMPRWASRILLEITSVRVQRVQDIGRDGRRAADVLAEGISEAAIAQQRQWYHLDDAPAIAFSMLWESVNAKRGFGWVVNPHVWAIEFKLIEEPT